MFQRGIRPIVTSTGRTPSEQGFLFQRFLEGKSAFPVAAPGTSNHEFGLAVDMVPDPPERLPEMVEIMRSVGFKWAGPSDSVHFDYILPLTRSRKRTTGPVARFQGSFVFPPRRTPGKPPGAQAPGACCCF